MEEEVNPFWSYSLEVIFEKTLSSNRGLSEEEAQSRLNNYGFNSEGRVDRETSLSLFLRQFTNPFILILIFSASLSFVLKDASDACIILGIVVLSSFAGFVQEQGAQTAVYKLIEIIQITATVLRDGVFKEVHVREVVPGDIISLHAGDIIPADAVLLEAQDLFINEAALTGESLSVEKAPGIVSPEVSLHEMSNYLFKGSNVVSGTAKAVVVLTGKQTLYGKIVQHVQFRRHETGFERDLRKFGDLLMQLTLTFVLAIFLFNVILHHPILDAFLFSLALAIGVTPQLLPTIVTIALSKGAKKMAEKRVITKKLSSIHDLGAMNVLCVDKTGTLTRGEVELYTAMNAQGIESQRVHALSYINASFQSGYSNIIDKAIIRYRTVDPSGWVKLDEIPYDFIRKRVSVLVSNKEDNAIVITKGSFEEILRISMSAEIEEGKSVDITEVRDHVLGLYAEWSNKGFRVLGVAYKKLSQLHMAREDEIGMTFVGFLLFYDPPKLGVDGVIQSLKDLGISLRMITGDNYLISQYIAKQIKIDTHKIIRGPELSKLSDDALDCVVRDTYIFSEVEPNQKERIILALKRSGYTVGFMGDGINDVVALHAADVGISVDSAVDAARQGADMVLLDHDLTVLLDGIVEGRKTVANTIKYLFIATGANFGNIFTMAGASLFLPFLPLLPKQILLTNLLSDIPEATIASDTVDPEVVQLPTSWDMQVIKRGMIIFGFISSIFDYIAFFIFLYILNLSEIQFRTSWFIESVITAASTIVLLRSRKQIHKSIVNPYLLSMVLAIVCIAFILPWTIFAATFEFTPIPLHVSCSILCIVIAYIAVVEKMKILFYTHKGGNKEKS